ncbi:MAG: hypothetical protein M1818_000765 [Claussenomyces sp. TS43310]|nr:MAG: hypothetical protein M1818_000765 [Claussenomyces sp. TS43310]
MLWWDDETIDKTVNRQFVLAQLREDERLRVDAEPFGGSGLTDHTYLEWIEGRVRRLFLILVDIGVPDQIFGVIDDSWDDDDLPIPLDQVDRLRLTPEPDPKLEKKFFQRQFAFLLKTIKKGDHLVYGEDEVVPLEVIEKRPVRVSGTGLIDKVYVPSKPEDIFLRRKVPLGDAQIRITKEEFSAGTEPMRSLEHKHLVSLWASYIHQDVGYILLTPSPEGNLKSIMTTIPPSLKILAKQDRRVLLLNWLHCLADALAFLHSRGRPHGSLKPSNVLIDTEHRICLSETSPFVEMGESKGFDKELYDYAAPEQWSRSAIISPQLTRTSTSGSPTATVRTAGLPSPPLPPGDNASIYTASTSSNTPSNSSCSTVGRSDPFLSDVFSLGCIFLEVLTVFLKHTSRSFQSHRSAKNRQAGRGGGLPDASFHKNLGQVQSWIQILSKDASKKDDKLHCGVREILDVVSNMLSLDPGERLSAGTVSNKFGSILTGVCKIEELCCCAYSPKWDISAGTATLTIGIPPSSRSTFSPASPTFPDWPIPASPPSPEQSRATQWNPVRSGTTDSYEVMSTRTKRLSSGGSSTVSTLAMTNGVDGKSPRPRRFASGGGRTAPPKSAVKAWSAPMPAEQKAVSDKGAMEEENDGVNDADDNKSMWNLRYHDYDTGTVRAVGWEELG